MAKFAFNRSIQGFSEENALFLARASGLAYLREDAGLQKKVREELGLSEFRFFGEEEKSTQCFVAADAKKVIVSFRGTEIGRIHDWLRNANIDFKQKYNLEPRKEIGQVHRGFDEALEEVWDELFEYVKRLRSKPMDLSEIVASGQVRILSGENSLSRSVWLTGHSLGGALATLMASRMALVEDFPLEGVYTFGQPRVTDRELARTYNSVMRSRHFRVVNNNDLVTRVPPRILGYSHVGQVHYFDVDGQLHVGVSWWNRFLDRVKGKLEDFVEVFKGDLVPDALEDHSLDSGYFARLAAWTQKRIG